MVRFGKPNRDYKDIEMSGPNDSDVDDATKWFSKLGEHEKTIISYCLQLIRTHPRNMIYVSMSDMKILATLMYKYGGSWDFLGWEAFQALAIR